MNLKDYIFRCIDLGYYKEKKWLQTLFGIPLKSNAFYNKEKDLYIIEGEGVSLGKKKPLIGPDDSITIDLDGKKKEVSVYRYIANIIYILKPFNGKIPYQDRKFTYITIFKDFILKDLINPDNKNAITIAEYERFMKAITFSHALCPLIVYADTVKTITKAPGIDAYKKKLIKEYVDKYGKDVMKDELKMLEIDDKLKAFDADYMKDDPSMGIVTTKKIMNVSRKNKFISIGKPIPLVATEETGYIIESLAEGTPLDAKKIADINNGIRFGSASRGMETQLTGLIAKYLSAASRGFKVKGDDCGTKQGYVLFITSDNIRYINDIRYDVKNNLIHAKVGDKVEMRDYLYCKAKGSAVCKKCVGRVADGTYNPALLTNITTGGKGLSSSLAKFHAVVKTIVILDPKDLFN